VFSAAGFASFSRRLCFNAVGIAGNAALSQVAACYRASIQYRAGLWLPARW